MATNKLQTIVDIATLIASAAAAVGLIFAGCQIHTANKLSQAGMIGELSERVESNLVSLAIENINVDQVLKDLYILYKYGELDVINQPQHDQYRSRYAEHMRGGKGDKFRTRWAASKSFYESGFQKYVEKLLNEEGL